jgi:molybdate-binding protein
MSLLHVAEWEEGLASQPSSKVRSAAGAVRRNLRWVGRRAGAAARRYQDELLGQRRPPRRTALDHRSVAEAIRNQWADVGICLRLTAEEGQLAFLALGQESYDLCFRRELADDPRIARLIGTVCSTEYRKLLGELPGYREQPSIGEIEPVSDNG